MKEKKAGLSRTLFQTYSAMCSLHNPILSSDQKIVDKEEVRKGFPTNASAINDFLGRKNPNSKTATRVQQLMEMGFIRQIKPHEYLHGVSGFDFDELDQRNLGQKKPNLEKDDYYAPQGSPRFVKIKDSVRWYVPTRGSPFRLFVEEVLEFPFLSKEEIDEMRKKILEYSKKNKELLQSPIIETNHKEERFTEKKLVPTSTFEKGGTFSGFLEHSTGLLQEMEKRFRYVNYRDPYLFWVEGIEAIEFDLMALSRDTSSHYTARSPVFQDENDDWDGSSWSRFWGLIFWKIFSDKYQKIIDYNFPTDDVRLNRFKEIDFRSRYKMFLLFTHYSLNLPKNEWNSPDLKNFIEGLSVINGVLDSDIKSLSHRERSFLETFKISPMVLNVMVRNLEGKPTNFDFPRDLLLF